MNKILIAGGTGFIGQALIQHWQDREIAIVSRHPSTRSNHKIHTWNELKSHGQEIISHYDLILNLAGANIGSRSWSARRKAEILESRIETSRLLSDICQSLQDRAPPLFNASAIGVYDLHDADHDFNTEKTVIDFDAAPNFLAQVARAWEKATWSIDNSISRRVNLRFAVVFAKQGGALKKIALPFYPGLGGKIGSGQQIMSWVHIKDLISALEFIFDHPEINGPVNIVAPEAVSQAEFAKCLAGVLHRPCFFQTPGFLLKALYGQMAEELLLKGQRVYPDKLITAGFQFKYPRLKQALESIFKR